jgi:F-type H+-transporting ATPase subunit gamma
MASTRDIRRRIKSIKNTSQITKAMQMVAASKMRKAQAAAVAGRDYAALMNEVLAEVTYYAGDFTHPLMAKREGEKRCVVLISTDKGLCGALNSNLMREAAKFDKDSTVYISAGRKGSQFLARTKRKLSAEFTYKDAPLFAEARAISRFAQDLFLKGEVDRVDVLFTNFISTLTQRPEVFPFLPVGEIKGVSAEVAGEKMAAGDGLLRGAKEFLFEPSADSVLGAMLPHGWWR